MRKYLDADQARLYEMIWQRAVASQMQPAEIERTTVEIEARNGGQVAGLRAVGSVIRFDGFIAAYTEDRDDDAEKEDDRRLPEIRANEELAREKINSTKHTTEPPPRYSEASLIKRMEELGIGRPSTYAATLKTLEDRDYVTIEKRRLTPQPKGRLVTAFLESFFERYVEYDFTAALEEKLDEISAGKLSWKEVLRDFWREFSGSVDGIKELRVAQVLDALNEELAPLVFPEREDGSDPRICPKCGTGNLSLKLGRYGAFVGCSNYPECGYTRQLGDQANGANGEVAAEGDRSLGKDPYTGEEIVLKSGRFGPYVQRGEGKEAKRSSLPKGWTVDAIDHEKALALLSLPRDVGQHPETGKMISAGLGRYGPFVLHDGTYANLESIEDVFSIGINRAVSVIAEKQSKTGRGRGTPAALKSLGDHPDGGPITVRDGRFGPYVNWGKINATLPKGKEPATVTVEEALELIAAKAAKGGKGTRKAAARKAPAKKPAAKKSTAKKPASKKSAGKAAKE
jgi:DNA topoisomerase I